MVLDLTWFEFRPLGMEFDAKLRGYYINNVYPVGKGAYILRLRKPEAHDKLLLIHVRRAAWITTEAPKLADMDEGTRLLRKYLNRFKIESSSALPQERIVMFTLSTPSSRRNMYMEFFGHGNVIVTDREGIVLTALHEIVGDRRQVRAGIRYVQPEIGRKSLLDASPDEIRDALGTDKPVEKALGMSFLAPRKYLEELLWRVGISKGVEAESLHEEDVIFLSQELKRLANELLAGSGLYLYYDSGGRPVEVSSIRLRSLEDIGFSQREFSSPSEALDSAFGEELGRLALSSKLSSSIEEMRRIEQGIERYSELMEEYRRKAIETRDIASRLMRGEVEVASVLQDLAKMYTDMIVAGDRIHIGNEVIRLDNRFRIASKVFDLAKRLDVAAKSIKEKRDRAEGRLVELKEKLDVAAKTLEGSKIKGSYKKWYERYRWFYTCAGILAVGGREASSNSALIRRYADPSDIVFHAEIAGSPFFLLKGGRKSHDERDVIEVAQAVVSFSRAWREGLFAADAYYVYPEQVSTRAPSGEYLPRGSFMIYGERTYIKGLRLQLAVGIILDPSEDSYKLCSGPSTAIHEHGLVYIMIEPGYLKPSDMAKKSLRVLKDHAPQDVLEEMGGELNLDNIQRLLPPGSSRIVGLAKGKRLRT